jgi:hypothetical protein
MPRHRLSFTLVLLTIFSITNAAADSPQQAKESAATGSEIDTSPTVPSIGRYAMTAYQETLALLDTATGNTWLLKGSADAGAASWSPIQRELDSSPERSNRHSDASLTELQAQAQPDVAVVIRGSKNSIDKLLKRIKTAYASKPSAQREQAPESH